MLDYSQEMLEEHITESLFEIEPITFDMEKNFNMNEFYPVPIFFEDGIVSFKPIMLFPFGKFSHPLYKKLNFDEKFFNEIIENFRNKVLKTQPFIDERHDEGSAKGWFTDLFINSRGLWAEIEWNEDGIELIQNKKYKYISPWYGTYKDEKTNKKYKNVLFGAALTNRPFLKIMPAVELSEDNKEMEPTILQFDEMIGTIKQKVSLKEITSMINTYNTTDDEEIRKGLKDKIISILNTIKEGGVKESMSKKKIEQEIIEKEIKEEAKKFPEDFIKNCMAKGKTREECEASWAKIENARKEEEATKEEVKEEEKEIVEEKVKEKKEVKKEVDVSKIAEELENIVEKKIEKEVEVEEEIKEEEKLADTTLDILEENKKLATKIKQMEVEKLLNKEFDGKKLSNPASKIIQAILMAEDSKEIMLSDKEEDKVDLFSAIEKLLAKEILVDMNISFEEEDEKPDFDSKKSKYVARIAEVQKEQDCSYAEAMDIVAEEKPELTKEIFKLK